MERLQPPVSGKADCKQQMFHLLMGHRFIPIVILFLFFVLLLYFNSLENSFTNWDDGMVYSNPVIRSLDCKNLLGMFTPKKAATYQPIRVLSYAIDYHFWGLNPLGYHLTNIFFYLLTCITVFFAARLLLREILNVSPTSAERTALFTALLFAAHPVHVESVTWLAARKEVLQGFFFFLSFYLFMRYEKATHWRIFGGILLTFLLAILSKPSAVVLPAVFLLYDTAKRGGAKPSLLKGRWPFLIGALGLSLFFIAILLKVMVESEQIKPFYGGTLGSNLLAVLYLIPYNIKLLAFTRDYSAAYTVTASFSLSSPWTLAAIGTDVLLLALWIRSKKRANLLWFCIGFFLITLLPYLNLIPISTPLADRYVFLPSFGYCLLVGFVFNRLFEMKPRFASGAFLKGSVLCMFFLLLSCYAYLTVQQNKVWKNSFTLWSDAIRKYPGANLANAMMGEVYLAEEKYDKALPYLAKAVQIIPTDIISRNALGITYLKLGDPEKALREFLAILRIRPDDEMVRFKVAVLYGEQNEEQKSKEILEELIRRKPDKFVFHLQMGYLHQKMGHLPEALSEFERSARISPEKASPYLQMGDLYLGRLRDPGKAAQCYTEAIRRMKPSDPKTEEIRRLLRDLKSRH